MEKKLWFKRKTFGYGWTPSTIEGWIAIIIFVGAALLIGFSAGEDITEKEIIFKLLVPIIVLVAVFSKSRPLVDQKAGGSGGGVKTATHTRNRYVHNYTIYIQFCIKLIDKYGTTWNKI